jgi:hypothetical protein
VQVEKNKKIKNANCNLQVENVSPEGSFLEKVQSAKWKKNEMK